MAIPLQEYAKKNHVVPNTVRYWLIKKQVRGFKSGRKWYIYDLPRFEDFLLNYAWEE
ncbi:MAG: hypothetical protein SFW36_04090 [Leptolyngbyaceae cyanobacterium bins.59]|nr:hypothetical protein [Leptolyngbyaceae cyanobacterium bins.59]